MTTKGTQIALKFSAVLWVIWGAVHTLAGFLTISSDTTTAIAGIADLVDPITLSMGYPDAVGAIVNQHGFNLLWFGLVTLVGAVYIWKGSYSAVFITALVGGLADVGYFVFIDLGGFNHFAPGTVMTIVSASAIIISFTAYFLGDKQISKQQKT